jgi:hypothetical protein
MNIKNIHSEPIQVSASDPKMGREFLGGKYVDEKTRKSIRYFSPTSGKQRIVDTIDVERLGAFVYAVATGDIRGYEVELAIYPKEVNGRIDLMDIYKVWREKTNVEEVN